MNFDKSLDPKTFCCLLCNKKYTSNNSLCNHIKKYHEKEHSEKKKNILNCKYCSKSYSCRQSKYIHQKNCKEKEKYDAKIINNNNTINNNTINNNSNNNNTVINNNIVIQVKENDYKTYDFNSKKDKTIIPVILDDNTKLKLCAESFYNLIPKLVEKTYCGKYIQLKNVLITNLTNKYAYVYKNGKFVTDTKERVLDILFENNCCNLENIYDDVKCMENIKADIMDKIDKNYKKFIEKCEADDVKYGGHKNFKEFSKEKMLLLLYDNRDNIKCAVISDTELTEDEIQIMIQKKEVYDSLIDNSF
jgi:hypothetical protein